jgi:hypothetical protein
VPPKRKEKKVVHFSVVQFYMFYQIETYSMSSSFFLLPGEPLLLLVVKKMRRVWDFTLLAS